MGTALARRRPVCRHQGLRLHAEPQVSIRLHLPRLCRAGASTTTSRSIGSSSNRLAADRLGLPEGDPALAALGFLTVGPRLRGNPHDVIDDRIDVVTRGFMGMTVACARCHDHKYDPIPTADYYSLYGVFNSSYEPDDLPAIGQPDDTPAYRAYLEEHHKREQAAADYLKTSHAELLQSGAASMSPTICWPSCKGGQGSSRWSNVTFEHGRPRENLTRLWVMTIRQRVEQNDPVFLPWGMLAATAGRGFCGAGPQRHRGPCRFQRHAVVHREPSGADGAASLAAAVDGRRCPHLRPAAHRSRCRLEGAVLPCCIDRWSCT